MSEWQLASELIPPETVSGIIYGDVGVGKTLLALSSLKPALIDLEKGSHRAKDELMPPLLPVLKPDSYQELVNGLDNMPDFKTIVIDTMGKLFDDYLIPYIKKEHPTKLKRDGELSIQGYGERKKEFKKLMQKIKAKGCNFIILAHVSTIKKEDDTIKFVPDLGIKNENYLAEIRDDLDFIGFMTMTGKRRTIAFNPTSAYEGKNSIDLEDFIQVPALETFMDNNFIQKCIIEPTIIARKEQKELSKKRDNVVLKAQDKINKTKNPNEVLDYFKTLDTDNGTKFYLLELLKQATSLQWNEESKRFE